MKWSIPALAALPAVLAAQQPMTRESVTIRAYDGRTMPAFQLSLPVPERRGHTSRTITIAALRLPATTATPGDPIVFLMGGPGIPGSVMAPIPPYFTLFEKLRSSGDVIVMDQRGIGRSAPALDCPVSDSLPDDIFVSRASLVNALTTRVARCADSLRAAGAEPAAYSSRESAEDLEALRAALGAPRLRIVAFSYGTRLALLYARLHGDRVSRMVLQGVNGPGLVAKRPGPVARKLGRLNALLASDTAWPAGTDLLAAARTARARLDATPATVSITDRRSGARQLMVGREGFDVIVALNLDDARLPVLLTSVAAGDDAVLTRFVEAAWNGLRGGTAGLMARAVNCSADRPSARWRLVEQEARTAPFGDPVDNAFLREDFCGAIGVGGGAAEFPRGGRIAAPTLLLTGTLDATNPVENAVDVAQGLASFTRLDIENAAHEALTIPVVQDVAVAFLSGDNVQGRSLVAPSPRFPRVIR